MKFEWNDQALGYLEKRKVSDVTLEVVDLPTTCCLGRLPEIKISYEPPANPNDYRHFHAQGIGIHLSRTLRTQEKLRFFVSGWGPFKSLEVAGVNLVM